MRATNMVVDSPSGSPQLKGAADFFFIPPPRAEIKDVTAITSAAYLNGRWLPRAPIDRGGSTSATLKPRSTEGKDACEMERKINYILCILVISIVMLLSPRDYR